MFAGCWRWIFLKIYLSSNLKSEEELNDEEKKNVKKIIMVHLQNWA